MNFPCCVYTLVKDYIIMIIWVNLTKMCPKNNESALKILIQLALFLGIYVAKVLRKEKGTSSEEKEVKT